MANTPSTKTNPQAAFIIWNYEERTTADPVKDPHAIEQIYINTSDVISMSTSKSKAQPSGSFQVRLAPTVNWTAKLTPGSWCVILMSRDEIPVLETDNRFPSINLGNPVQADRRLVKMFGRIVSSRLSVNVDQSTGARKSEYVVTGEDWGSIFNAKIYIDPILRNNNFDKLSAIGEAERLFLDKLTVDYLDQKVPLPTSSNMVDNLLGFWGKSLSNLFPSPSLTGSSSSSNSTQLPLTNVSGAGQYRIPTEVANYFGFSNTFVQSVGIGDILKVYHGILKAYDKYSGDTRESYGFPNPASLYGINSFWQMLTDNSNSALNELVADMRWDGDTPSLALYHRIRPFVVRDTFTGYDQDQVANNISPFKNVKRTVIPKQDIISINAGTNLNEKINFIEVKPAPSFLREAHSNDVKIGSQAFDEKAYERDGFRPLIIKTAYLPYDNRSPTPTDVNHWKYLLREWHFNKDTMLNGAVSFIGLNDYIAVGDNIMIDASILGTEYNKPHVDSRGNAYMLAHVEQVEHDFKVDATKGARSFITTVKFVRGIITDENGKILGDSTPNFSFDLSFPGGFSANVSSDGLNSALDKKASDMDLDDERTKNVHKGRLKDDPGGGK